MTLLLCALGSVLLLVVLVVLANRRRSSRPVHEPPSAGVPVSGSSTTGAWTFGGGGAP